MTPPRHTLRRLFLALVLVAATTLSAPAPRVIAQSPGLSPALVGYWKFDEGSGTTATDSSDIGNAGTLVNGVARTAGKVNGGITCDGADDFVDVGDPINGGLDFGDGDFSISFWAKTSQATTDARQWPESISKNNKGIDGIDTGFEFYWGNSSLNSGKVAFKVTSGGVGRSANGSTATNDGQWHHYVGVKYSRGLELFTDGVSSGSDKGHIGSVSNAGHLKMCAMGDAGWSRFAGSLDEIRVYTGALSASDVQSLYIAEGSLAPAPALIGRGPAVTFDRIVRADQEPQNWLTYSGNLQGHRYSPLSQITKASVKDLELAWLSQAPTNSRLESTPLVVDGIMYTTRNTNDVVALDAETGRVIWVYRYSPMQGARATGGGGRPNRGLAILGSTLFLGTLDAHLVAIDALSGKLIWNTTVADARDAGCQGGPCYVITLAPLIVKDKVIVGVGGGEGRTRGFLAAFDSQSGDEVWRFYAIPAAGEPGNNTWSGDSWKIGGAPVWNTGAFDADLNLTYWGTGNPYPPWDGSSREGDNLYSNCVVALDADTGKLRWHYQFTPHDVQDWDSAQVPVLADVQWHGQRREVILWANRNGLLYVLDRTTGEFLMGKPFVEVNWMSGFDGKGRPILVPGQVISREAPVRPASATNWNPHSYSPSTGLFYVTGWERGGDGQGGMVGGKAYGAVRAFDPSTGDKKWEFRIDDAVFWRGVLTTASDILFTGTWGDFYSDPVDARRVDGHFYALDARTGQVLWKFGLAGSIQSPPITYAIRGKQYVAVAANDTLFSFALRR